MTQRPAVAVLNGPNLNLLGEREPEIYGPGTLADLEALCRAATERHGWDLDFRQTNHEGVLLEAIHEVRHTAYGLVLNAAGWTHTSVAIHDALALVACPVVEVHLSDVHGREAFRQHSYVTPRAALVILGRGPQGYVEAIDALAGLRAARASG
ncbi:MAG: type II 3-dehydroquinate dehydratase [Nostocoides sp.]